MSSNILLTEKVNITLLNEIIENAELTKQDRTILINYRKKIYNIENNIGNVDVKYKKSTGSGNNGRLYAEKGLSLQMFSSKIRHFLAKDLYYDLDIKNAHPSILLQVCEKNHYSHNELKNYVENRSDILHDIMNELDIDYEESKKLMLCCLYLKEPKSYLASLHIPKPVPEFVNKYYKECCAIADIIYNRPEGEKLKKILEKKKFETNHEIKLKNPKAQVLSLFIQNIENDILMCMYDRFLDLDYSPDVLVFDGIMPSRDKEINDEILQDIQNQVLSDLNYKIELVEKEMSNPIEIDEDDFDIDSFELDENYLDTYDKQYFISLKGDRPRHTYAMRKKYFEVFCSKVLLPSPSYVFYQSARVDIDFLSPSNMCEFLKGINSGFLVNGLEKSFFEVWSNDDNQLQYNNFEFYPFNEDLEKEPKNIYNLFKGFSPHIHAEYDINKKYLITKPFFELLDILSNHDPKVYTYLFNYFTCMIKTPRNRPHVIPILTGSQSIGKGCLLTAIKHLLGKGLFIASSNIKDFIGDHAEGFYKKLFVNLNESEGKDMFNNLGRIKEFISEPTMVVNPKHMRPFPIMNFAYMIVNSNSDNPFVLDVKTKERRVMLQKGGEDWISKGEKFWKQIHNHFEKPEFISALYDCLMENDIEGFDWRKERPITEAYKSLVKLYRPAIALFLQNWINTCSWNNRDEDYQSSEVFITNKNDDYNYEEYISITKKELFTDYHNYLKENKLGSEDKLPSIKSFENKLKSMNLPLQDIKPNNILSYKFNPKEVYTFMEINNLIDDDNTNYKNYFNNDDEENEEEVNEYFII